VSLNPERELQVTIAEPEKQVAWMTSEATDSLTTTEDYQTRAHARSKLDLKVEY
jgi:hypothetical protein